MTPNPFRTSLRAQRHALHCCIATCIAVLACATAARAVHPYVGFTELSQTADAIFDGIVVDVHSRVGPVEGTIVTDVTFDVLEVVHRRDTVRDDISHRVMLTFAGGQIGDRGVTVSGVPTFSAGEEYLVFTRLDGGSYLNPLVGGVQGIFKIIEDTRTKDAYPLSHAGFGVTAVVKGELEFCGRIEQVDDGVPTVSAPRVQPVPPPQSSGGPDEHAWSGQAERAGEIPALLNLDGFINEVHAALRLPPVTDHALQLTDVPSGVASRAGRTLNPPSAGGPAPAPGTGLTPSALPWLFPADPGAPFAPTTPGLSSGGMGSDIEGGPNAPSTRAALCYCGHFNLPLTMEQVPTNWWEWSENNDSMARFNHFMDIYRFVPDDGSFGNNNQNEFGGYPSSQTLINIYGQGWNGELAVTWTFWTSCACCTITQADVFFNPAYTWWQNLSDTLDVAGRALYRPIVDHELGHSWGMQRGSCTEDYSYNQISVMHAYYRNIIEDGYGIHHPEAWSIRRDYSNQTPIINRRDVGVESYYAAGNLRNSTTFSNAYRVGDAITVNNVTVENNSNTATAGVRLRFFLSGNNVITTGDYQMGTYWEWGSFSAEAYNTSNYAMVVPNVPPGLYYIGMIVSTGGAAYSGDDLNFNNATYLHDRVTISPPIPANDRCWDGIPIGLGTASGTTAGASDDGASDCGTGTADVWYSYTATCSGTLKIDSCGSSYDTVISVHSACPGGYVNEIQCSDDCTGSPCVAPASCLSTDVTAGSTYLIRVSGWNGQTGSFVLHLSMATPSNNACSGAIGVGDGANTFSTCSATTDGPADCSALNDVWYRYTATCAGYVTFSLCGSDFDTILGVYPDGPCPPINGTALDCSDDFAACGNASQVVLAANLDDNFLIRIGGWQGSTGAGPLTISCGECGLDEHCDDGDLCTFDQCAGGVCVHGAACDDNDVCTDDFCDGDGCHNVAIDCDDGDSCTEDTCDAHEGCQYAAVVCDDADLCTDDTCDPQSGCVFTAVVCDDADLCTDDSCDPQAGCQYAGVVCDDADACTDDSCVPQAGCQYTPLVCDDGDLCTEDTCDPFGGCIYTFIVCDDADLCTEDTCDPQFGCTYVGVVCDDGDPCTQDLCEAANGCVFPPLGCDDALYCNGQESCVDGECIPGEVPCAGQWCDEDTDTCNDYGAGDFDFDGHVDLWDFAVFQQCFGGNALPSCQPANFTGDGLIDLADYEAFEAVLTGP